MSVINSAIRQLHELPSEYQTEGAQHIEALTAAAKPFDTFMARAKQELDVKREEAHERAKIACRSQIEEIEKADLEIERLTGHQREQDSVVSAMRLQLRMASESKPSRYPLRGEIAAWQKSVQNAEKNFQKAQDKMQVIDVTIQRARQNRAALQERLQQLASEEWELRPESEKTGPAPNNFGLHQAAFGAFTAA